MNIHQWRGQIKRFNSEFAKHTDIREQWEVNSLENMPLFKKSNSIWNLEWKYYQEKEKAMVIVGSSPCLKDDVEKLKELDDNFIIVCANSSLKFLLKNGITPQYCICLDSDIIDIPRHLMGVESDKVTLLASTAVWSKILKQWKGEVYYMPYYSVDVKTRRKIRSRLGKGVPGGGNSMTQAFYLVSIIFGARTVIFVANEYCFDKRKDYYADTESAKQEKLSTIYPCVDVLGRDRWTLPAFYNYVIWQEKVCTDLYPPGFFADTSFGLLGKDCDAIHNMELSHAIKVVKEAFVNKKRLNDAKNEKARQKILKEVRVEKDAESDVFRYNVCEQREELLQLARVR
jgi:hypothetical protein